MSTLETKDLKSLLKDFYNLTGIKTCLYDLDGNELFFYPSKLNRFCEILRTDERMDCKCKSCDKTAFHQCKKTQAQYNYVCHAGLQECISPILYEGEIIGFMMLGQIKSAGAPDFSAIEKNLPLMNNVSAMFEAGMTPESVMSYILQGIEYDVFDDFLAEYTCDCDRERLLGALACFSDKELDETFAELDKIEVCCRFCDQKYYFTRKDIEKSRK